MSRSDKASMLLGDVTAFVRTGCAEVKRMDRPNKAILGRKIRAMNDQPHAQDPNSASDQCQDPTVNLGHCFQPTF